MKTTKFFIYITIILLFWNYPNFTTFNSVVTEVGVKLVHVSFSLPENSADFPIWEKYNNKLKALVQASVTAEGTFSVILLIFDTSTGIYKSKF